jgi:LPXTG-motif cell wall-anchored protein
MTKVLALLVALVAFAAIPSVAFAGDGGDGGERVEGPCQRGGDCEQENEIEEGNVRGDVGQQNCIATGDCHQSIDQSRRTKIHRSVVGVGGHDDDDDNGVTTGNVAVGGGVGGVTLARTGADAWIFALIGGVALAGGIGLLSVQRRRQTD